MSGLGGKHFRIELRPLMDRADRPTEMKRGTVVRQAMVLSFAKVFLLQVTVAREKLLPQVEVMVNYTHFEGSAFRQKNTG